MKNIFELSIKIIVSLFSFAILLALLFVLSLFLNALFYKPQSPFAGFPVDALTHTHSDMAKSFQILNIISNEQTNNPYVYGWSGDILYYKDTFGKQHSFNVKTKETKSEKISNPQFLRQSLEKCNDMLPTGYEQVKPEILNGVKTWCYAYSQGGTTIEVWPYADEQLVYNFSRILVLYPKDPQKRKVLEPATISDVVISENGKYMAITSNRCKGVCAFVPTDIFVIDLQKGN